LINIANQSVETLWQSGILVTISLNQCVVKENNINQNVMYENMIQIYQKITQLKVLTLFIENPYTGYYLRESARLLDMDPMTVKRSLNLLLRDEFLFKTEEKNRMLYHANMENPAFRHLKISYNLSYLHKKKIADFILNKMKSVTSIMLFGSFAKGENDESSDIDIVTISLSKDKPSAELAKLLERDVNLLNFTPAQWSDQSKKNRAFYLDVILDGIPLYGTIPVVE
jgi:predicted nucleotidyltransferase